MADTCRTEACVDIRLLGPLELATEDRPVRLPGAGEGAVLALLSLQAGRVCAAERLIDALWGEQLPANPTNALQIRVSKLRKALTAAGLDGAAVETRPPGYVLDIDPDQVDALRVQGQVHRARQLSDTGDREGAVAAYREALSNWRGTPLLEFVDADWAAAESRRLEELRLAATEQCLNLELDLGRHTEVLDELEGLTQEHPLRERLHGLLMLALYRCGRQADALTAFQAARDILQEELGLDPSPDLQGLESAILRHDPRLASPTRPASRLPSSLPERIASFVGRDREVEELANHLQTLRLLTVTGAGGTGKTTTAIATARLVQDDFEDEVVFVPLAGTSAAADVPATIGGAFGFPAVEPLPGESATMRLARQIGDRRSLMVLDNCEHLVDAAATTVERLLGACPHLVVLATSREALAVPGETQYALAPLPTPDTEATPDRLLEEPAIQLFMDRALASHHSFDPDHTDLHTIALICNRLDGIPLAIELAAARVRTLPLTQLASRLDDRFRVLTSGPRTADARHQTLRATVDWSYQLLGEEERVLFRRLGALRGSWSLQDAEAVCGTAPLEPEDILDLVARLVDRSLVAPVDGADRFRMLETIRQFAEERLREAGEYDDVMARHVQDLLELAHTADPQLRGPDQVTWLRRLEDRHDDLRVALAFCHENLPRHADAGLRLAGALGWFWYVGDHDEGRRHLHRLLEATAGIRDVSEVARGRALQSVALVERPSACVVHPSEPCADAARVSIPLLEGAGDTAGAARSRILLAVEGIRGGPADEAVATLQAALNDVPPDSWDAALAAFVRMEIMVRHGDTDAGLAEGDRAAAEFARLGDRWGVSAVKAHQGFNLRAIGRLDDALMTYEDGLEVARQVGLHNTVQLVAGEVAMLRLALGQTDQAEVALVEAETVARRYGYIGGVGFALIGRGFLARSRSKLDEADAHFARGVQILTEVASLPYLAWANSGRGHVRELLGDPDQAADCHQQVLAIAQQLQDPWLTALAWEGLAGVAVQQGAARRAAHLLGAADRLRRAHERPPSPLEAIDLDRVTAAARQALGPEAFDAAHIDTRVAIDERGDVVTTMTPDVQPR